MTDFYVRSSNYLTDDYKTEQTSIIKKKFLKHISRIPYEEAEELPLSQILDWYPLANSYYSYTEDVDAFARVNQLLGSKPSFDSFTNIADCEYLYEGNVFSEKEAQIQYLNKPPVSFLILGKPGIGELELGKLLADYWKCVYIEPETLLVEEIAAKTRTGQCIECNLRSGRAIGVDVLLRLLDKRTKSKTAKHRGFVVCGFPLVPNDLYTDEHISSESAVFNVHEIFEEIFDITIETGVSTKPTVSVGTQSIKGENDEEEMEEPPSEGSVSSPTGRSLPHDEVPTDLGSVIMSNICTTGGTADKDFEEQVDFVFSQFTKPFILIYMMCSNNDVVYKRKDCLYDFLSKQIIDLQREHIDKKIYTFFSRIPPNTHEEIPDDIFDIIKSNTMALDASPTRLFLKLPKDFPANVATLLDRYRYSVLPFIEKHFLVHHYEHLIKVDGRISPIRMFNAVKTKLRTLPLQKVVIPQKLLVPGDPGLEGPGDVLDVEDLSFEECFEIFKRKQIASTMFKWSWSDWGFKCPVSMREGDYRDGDPKLAVQFMNKIFFLCDEDAFLKFYRNPRIYLLPPYPKPSCKMVVLGPRCSGKTAISKCLGYLGNAEVVEYDSLEGRLLKLKEDDYLTKVRLLALATGIEELNKNRKLDLELAEKDRQNHVDFWIDEQKRLLEKAVMSLKDRLQHDEQEEDEQTPATMVPLDFKSSPITLDDYKDKNTIEELEKLLHLARLPTVNVIELCEELLQDDTKLLEYLPSELRPPENSTIEPATSEDDFVQEYAANAAKSASMEGVEKITLDDIGQFLVATVKEIEEKNWLVSNTKGGWIIDGLPPNGELFAAILENYQPDELFVTTDNDNHEFLLQRFEIRGLNRFRNYRNFFTSIGKPDAAWRSPSLKSTESYKSRSMSDVSEGILEVSLDSPDDDPAVRNETEPYFKKHPRRAEVEKYRKDLTNFDEDWAVLKDSFNLPNLNITEINVANKTLEDMMGEVVKNIDGRYRQMPSVFSPENRLQELQDFAEPELMGEEAVGEAEEKEASEDTFFQNRRFGYTLNYCPVIFHDVWVLWKGKEDFTAVFEDKLYLLSSETAMTNFLEDPHRYLSVNNAPPKMFPPPRICVVGVMGCGKTTTSRGLSRNLGLYYRNMDDRLRDFILPNQTLDLSQVLSMVSDGLPNRDMVETYLTAGEALEEEAWMEIVASLWLNDPVKTFGFVFDGFPKRPCDVQFMSKDGIVPDIVVELTMSEAELHKRLMDKFVENWQKELDEKLERVTKERQAIISAWEEERNAKFKELLEQRRQGRYLTKKTESKATETKNRPYLEDLPEMDEEGASESGGKSEISYYSVDDQEDIDEVSGIIAESFPEPVFEDEPEETMEEAAGSFSSMIIQAYAQDSQYLEILHENCETELIPWVTVDASMSEDKVLAQIMFVVDKYKFRNESLFERVYNISVDLAERLLGTGYYFLSSFGKTCPVQVFEQENPIQMFLPMEAKFQLFPLIHRQYVYYLAGQESRDKFKENPLKYTRQKNCGFPLIPMRLGIIGPPKSGKTTLAERFKRDLGMKVVSRGQAGRYVLRYLEFSELAKSMESVLRLGWELTYEMVAKCAEASIFDGSSITQGFVLDGFPCTKEEVRHLVELGMVPRLVIDLQANHADVFEFLGADQTPHNTLRFSKKFFEHLHEEWSKNEGPFKDWLDEEYQIVAKVPVKPSLWGVWAASFELTSAVFSEVKHYFKFSPCDVVLRLSNMQVSPLEFIERQSSFKNYCPGCLYYKDGLLKMGGNPPDRTGLVQFRKYFYFICEDHIDAFVEDPEKYLPPYNRYPLPHDLPIGVSICEMPQNVYEEGFCVVCYTDKQPMYAINSGKLKFAIIYREKVYLFDTEECMKKFMEKPHKYYAKCINVKRLPSPSLTYKELPVLGLLEQYDVKQLIKAIVNTGIIRPVIPGLSVEISGALNIGLFLKMHNPRTPTKFLELFGEAQKKYHEKRLKLLDCLANMKKTINPYLYYDEPLSRFEDPLFPYPKKYPDDSSTGIFPKDSIVSDDVSFRASSMLYDQLFDRLEDFGEGDSFGEASIVTYDDVNQQQDTYEEG